MFRPDTLLNGFWIYRTLYLRFIFTVLVIFCSFPVCSQELPRKVLALYNEKDISGSFKDIHFTKLHRFVEMPANHLGLEFVYHELHRDLPALDALSGYRGIVLWVNDMETLNDPLCAWLQRAMGRGYKAVIFLGGSDPEYPMLSVQKISPKAVRMFRDLGVELEDQLSVDPVFTKIIFKDAAKVEFERKLLLRELFPFPVTRRLSKGESYIRLQNIQNPAENYEPVIVTPRGGLAVNPFVLYVNKQVVPEQARWRINPFIFLEESFGVKGWPRPDTATRNGRRIYYSHIDGDGIFNVSEVDQKSWSGEVFLKEFLEKYPFSPFTVSLITGYYSLRRYSTAESKELSQKILNLPNVEPASHGYAHPLIWHKGTVALQIPDYRFDPEKEIAQSIDYINQTFLSSGKKANIFQWTGDCVPEEGHFQPAAKQDLLNINGGDSRFDTSFRSYLYVSPLSRLLSAGRQIYSSNSNENVYTGLWEGPFYGYREVLETFKNTETPVRVKPVNVYIHFYSAEKIASLKVLKEVYEWSFRQPLFPMYAGDYIRIVQSFFELKMFQVSSGRFRFEGGPHLRTVRFDGENRYPDFALSRGVIGYRHYQNSLYVFFEDQPVREVELTQRLPSTPHLIESNCELQDWRSEKRQIYFSMKCWWKGEVRIGGLKPNQPYTVQFGQSTLSKESDPEGQLKIELDAIGPAGEFQKVHIFSSL